MSSKTKTTATKEGGKPALVPKLRFPEFRGAAGWEQETIGEVCKSFSGGTPSTAQKDYYGGNIPFIRSAEIDRTETELFLTDVGLKNSAAKLVEKGDVLIALYGANSGDVALGKIDGAINQAILCLQSESSNAFIYQFLSHRQSWIISTYLQGGQGNLSGDIVKSISLGFPTPPEQQKIAECLSSVDELMAAQARKVDALKTHKKGLMQQLFPREGETQPRLRFPEFQNAGEWGVKPLGKAAENLDNRRRPITSSDRVAGDVPYYGASGIVDYVEGFIFDEDLLCVSEDGANLVARTYPIAFPISGKTWVNNHAHVLRFANACTQKFVEVYLNSIKLDDFITGMAQPKLNKAMLDKIPIPYPKVAEQQHIASCLSSLDALITAETQKHEALKTHKKGLMQQLFPSPEEVAA